MAILLVKVLLSPYLMSAMNLLSGIAFKKQIRIDHNIGGLPKVFCRPAKISQVVINLVTK